MDFVAQSQFTLGEEARRAVLTSTLETQLQKHVTRKLKKGFTAAKSKAKDKERSPSLHSIPSTGR